MRNYKEVKNVEEAQFLEIKKEDEDMASIFDLTTNKKYELKKDKCGEKYVLNNNNERAYPLSVIDGILLKGYVA